MNAALYISPVAAAAELCCSHSTILRAIKRGDLPAVKYGTRLVRIPRPAFDAWIAKHTTAAA